MLYMSEFFLYICRKYIMVAWHEKIVFSFRFVFIFKLPCGDCRDSGDLPSQGFLFNTFLINHIKN